MITNKVCIFKAIGMLLALIVLKNSSVLAVIVCDEETPINRIGTKFIVQYILEGDIIMINECECSPADQCEDKNSIELVKYRCRGGNFNVCCVNQMTKRTNEIDSVNE